MNACAHCGLPVHLGRYSYEGNLCAYCVSVLREADAYSRQDQLEAIEAIREDNDQWIEQRVSSLFLPSERAKTPCEASAKP